MFIQSGYNQNRILWAAETNPGLVRSINEDYYIARPACGLWVLCDGLGGHGNGSQASRLCAETISLQVLHGAALTEAIQAAHQAVRHLRYRGVNSHGQPASTVAALLVEDRNWTVAWAGDTRVWLFENQLLKQVTKDHTVIRKLLDWGVISKEDAPYHPDRHKVTTAVGIGQEPLQIGLRSGAWNEDQVFLLATDGMAYWDDPEMLLTILQNTIHPDQVVDELVYASLQAGARDNFTVAAVGRSVKKGFFREALKRMRDGWDQKFTLVKPPHPVRL